MIDFSGGSRGEVLQRISTAQTHMDLLEKQIWKSSIWQDTKILLYETHIVPVLMDSCETWATRYLYTGSPTDPEDSLFSSCIERASQGSVRVSPSFQHGNGAPYT